MVVPLNLVMLFWLGASCVLGEMALLTRDATSMRPTWHPDLPAELSPATHTEQLAHDATDLPILSDRLKICAAYTAASLSDVARGCYEALLDLHTTDFDTQYAYAQLLSDHFPGPDAVAAFEAAIAIAAPPYHQAHIDAFNTLGLYYRDQLAFEKAASVFAIPFTPTNRSHPSFLPLLINLGAVHLQQGDLHAALALTNDALVAAPENALVHHNLGSVYFNLRDFSAALRYSQRATELDPTLIQSHMAIGIAVCHLSDSAAAVAAFDAALAIPSSHKMTDIIRLMQATAGIPQITLSTDAIAASRQTYASRLRDLSRQLPLQLGIDPLQTIGCGSMGYSLIYQGGIDRQLREELATIYRTSMPSLSFVAPHVQANRQSINVYRKEGRRIRLGVLSAFLYGHTVGLLLQGVLTQLDRATFEIYLLRTSRDEDAVTQHLRSRADHDILLPSSVVAAQHTIAALALDILLFSEIGMDKTTYFLAFAQLALRSVVFWGHAITSGISTVDYAITSPLFGTHQKHYTERLYAMQGLTTAFYKPTISQDAFAADSIVLELQQLHKTVYLVPQTLYKLHPALDPLLQRILEAQDDAVIVFLKGETPELANRMYERWTLTLSPSVLARVYYLPNMPRQQFLHVCAAADVVLDTFPVGGGRTTLEILAVGTPVIVHEPRTTILQLSAAMYTLMDMPEMIAYSDDDYVAKALAVGRNATYRRLLSQRIVDRHDVLFNQSSVVDEWSRMLQTMVATPPPDLNQQPSTDADPILFGVYLYLQVLHETFAFQVRASERHRTMDIATTFGQVHELEPLYVAFIETVLYKGVSRLDQPIVATLHVPSPGLDPDQIAVDIRLGDDIWLAAHCALWQHRVQSSRDVLYRIWNEWRSIGGQLDTTLPWRAIRDRFPETNYVPTPVSDSCVTLVLTTCKRLSLFLRTMASLSQLRASSMVCATIVIDDHSSDDDRRVMATTFPTVRFLYTRVKGHAVAMNTLLSVVSTRFVLYIEDDWVFQPNVTQSVHDALGIFRSHWNDPNIRLAQVLLNDQESGWLHSTPSAHISYRVLEMGVADPAHKMSFWPGFSLNPGVWDLDRLKAQRLRFDTTSDVFERAFSLQVRRAGLHVAALTTTVASHIGAPPGSNASAYVLNGLPRRFDAPLV